MSNLPEKAQFAVINKFGEPEVFEILEKELPAIKPDQLLIKVYASSINPIDWKQRKGNHKLILGSPFPITLGYDVSGIVVKAGEKTTKFKAGDEIFGVLDNKYGGAYGQFAIGTEKCFTYIPKDINKTEVAAYPMVTLTALQALRDKAKVKPGQTIMINGASGGVGHVAIQVAKIMKANVIAIASNNSESFVRKFNPDKFIDYTTNNILDTDYKADVFFDVVGNYSFPKTKHLLKKGGIYLNLNFIDSMIKMPISKIYQLLSGGKKSKSLLMKHEPADLDLIKEWIEQDKVKIHINDTYYLNDIVSAHTHAQKGHSKGKNIIKMY